MPSVSVQAVLVTRGEVATAPEPEYKSKSASLRLQGQTPEQQAVAQPPNVYYGAQYPAYPADPWAAYYQQQQQAAAWHQYGM